MVNLADLRRLSARVGADPLLVQGPGGNTSVKDDGVMWIKASGTWLAEAETRDIFVPLDFPRLVAALERDDPDCATCMAFVRTDLNALGLRPSIETSVHALMPQRVVLHAHCVETIAWAIREGAEQVLRAPLAGFRWAYVPYARPGLPLAAAIRARIRPDTDVLVLGNHGLAVAADTVESAATLLARVSDALRLPVRTAGAPDLARLATICQGSGYQPATDVETHALATDPHALAMAGDAVLYPDHAVFLGVGVPNHFNGAPLVVIEGCGVAVRAGASKAAEPMGRCLADVVRRTPVGTRLTRLSAGEIAELIDWDAEKYRQSLAKASP